MYINSSLIKFNTLCKSISTEDNPKQKFAELVTKTLNLLNCPEITQNDEIRHELDFNVFQKRINLINTLNLKLKVTSKAAMQNVRKNSQPLTKKAKLTKSKTIKTVSDIDIDSKLDEINKKVYSLLNILKINAIKATIEPKSQKYKIISAICDNSIETLLTLLNEAQQNPNNKIPSISNDDLCTFLTICYLCENNKDMLNTLLGIITKDTAKGRIIISNFLKNTNPYNLKSGVIFRFAFFFLGKDPAFVDELVGYLSNTEATQFLLFAASINHWGFVERQIRNPRMDLSARNNLLLKFALDANQKEISSFLFKQASVKNAIDCDTSAINESLIQEKIDLG